MNPTNGIMGQINNINAMHQGFAKPLSTVRPVTSIMQPKVQPVTGGKSRFSGLMGMAQRFLRR